MGEHRWLGNEGVKHGENGGEGGVKWEHGEEEMAAS